jgi:uncharacterized protein YkwD
MAFAAALMAAVAGSAHALPASLAYPGRNGALSSPSEEERELLETVQADRRAWHAAPLEWDGMISAVAREHAGDMAEYDHMEYTTPRLGTIEYRLHRSGVSASNARYVIFRAGSLEAVKEQIVETGLHLENTTHIGIGVVAKGRLPRRLFATILLVEKHTRLERFPTMPLGGRAYRLAGRIEEGFAEPELIITYPDGSVLDRPIKLNEARRFDEVVRFNKGNGKYSVELAAQGKLGAAILDLMHCYAGTPYPPPSVPNSFETPKELDRAELAMLGIVNRARADYNLSALDFDDRVTAVARKHSRDMLEKRFFAHVSPANGTLQDRLERAGIRARRFAENLASNRSLAEAHQGLMDSPGHRRNILDPNVTRVGIGIARSEDGQLLITENFIQPFEKYDTAALGKQLFEAINEARAKESLPAVRHHAALESAARANSTAMLKEDKIGYETASRILDEKSPRLKYVQMSVLKSADPPVPAQVADVMNRRYAVIGIGIVQGDEPDGDRPVYTTVLLGEK